MHRKSTPCCDGHYGGGELRFYRGPIYNQSGFGFFGDLFRRVLPLVAPYIGKQLVQTGSDIASNIKEGIPIGKALKQGVKRAYDRGKSDAIRKLRGGGGRYKKARRAQDAFSL